ncbi:MAG: hypothetical protein OXI81_16690 [Paracoccaceae bacterium]|nr:hypothetical protein [Paracoccaceae bacterium]MDE2912709.1 hypothetical protein [Paracoccaceae bacterium]
MTGWTTGRDTEPGLQFSPPQDTTALVFVTPLSPVLHYFARAAWRVSGRRLDVVSRDRVEAAAGTLT